MKEMQRLLMIAVLFLISCGVIHAQIYRVAEMNAEQIRVLDRQSTVVIRPGGVLEEHGPHLPSYSDGYQTSG